MLICHKTKQTKLNQTKPSLHRLVSSVLNQDFSVVLLWPRKESVMKMQTRILDNRLYYTRKIELHCCTPHLTGKCGTRPFLGGSGDRAVSHTRPAFPKMRTAPSAFPLLGAPQAPGDEPNPPKGVNTWRGGPLRPKEISRYRDTFTDNTASRSATWQLERFRPILIYLSGSEISQY